MLENNHSKYVSFNSDFLSATMNKENGAIAFFGIESSGRDRDKHASYNLMIPAYGGIFGAFKRSKAISSEITDSYSRTKRAVVSPMI